VSPRVGLDGCGKCLPPNGIRSPDRPARSESLYRLSYSVPPLTCYVDSHLFILPLDAAVNTSQTTLRGTLERLMHY